VSRGSEFVPLAGNGKPCRRGVGCDPTSGPVQLRLAYRPGVPSTCFCGCGREIKGIRTRANNAAAAQMSQHLAVMRGALERGEPGGRAAETQATVDEGTALVDAIRRYLHGEIGRDDLDRAATKDWLRKGTNLADTLVSSTSGPRWEPDDPTTAHLAQSGQRASGVITDVRRNGLGNERVSDLVMTVSFRSTDGTPMALTRTLSIAVVKAPRVGDRVEVAYDASEPDGFVYRPLLDVPSDER
jgi:hypothetical protein